MGSASGTAPTLENNPSSRAKMAGMRIVVTGASGHVGGAIARHAAEAGHDVLGVSRRPSGIDGVEDVNGDLGAAGVENDLGPRVQRCDAVVHAAAELDKAPLSPAVLAVNCEGTRRMCELAEQWGATRFVYISGVTVIGSPEVLPIAEDHPCRPRSSYHASKLFGEHLVRIAAEGRFRASSLRVTAPVGPGMPGGRILSHFATQAVRGEPLRLAGQGTRRQDFVDVRDVATAALAAVKQDTSGVMNIGSGRSVSNHELAELCRAIAGSESTIEWTGQADAEEGIVWDVSIDRARHVLGWAPTCVLEDSIAAVMAEVAA